MKNLFRVILFTLVFCLTACGSDESTDAGTSGGTDSSSTSTDTPAADATVYTVTTSDSSMDFDPKDLTIAVGDVVRFEMTATHNAIEVTQDTYENRGGSPLVGGFQVTFGETREVTFSEAGTFYYVCQPHVMMEMIGTITVE